jgi:hypothetical protein
MMLRTSMYFWNLSAIRSLDCRMVCAVSRFRRLSMFERAMSTSSRPSTVNTNVMIVNESRPWMRAPISCTARMSQPALKLSTSRLVSNMPWPSSQSVSCRYNAWNRAALSMSQRPTVPKLQAIRPTEHGHHDERHDERREQRHKRGHSGLQGALQRPYDGDDEERECDRSEDRAREIERRKHQHRGAEAEHDQCGPAGHAGLVRSSVRQRWVVMF